LYDFSQTFVTDVPQAGDHDVIRFEGTQFTSFDDLVNSGAMAQSGANVVITLDATDQITLRNVMVGNLHAGDFLFM
jgi:hypothetical protein